MRVGIFWPGSALIADDITVMATAGTTIPRHVVLTGLPGTGKTTLVQKVCDVLQRKDITLQGFYTEEVRQHGKRIGFDVVSLHGTRGVLARIGDTTENDGRAYRVGQYTVKIQSFEQIAIPALKEKSSGSCVYIIDEVGKMEMFSKNFVHKVRDLLERRNTTVLTTIPVAKGKQLQLVEEIRHRKDVVLYQVTQENRDKLLDEIAQSVVESSECYHAR